MTLNQSQTDKLLRQIAATVPDELDCDGCLELLPLFVELIVAAEQIPVELLCVRIHLEQCECCTEEFQVIVECLKLL